MQATEALGELVMALDLMPTGAVAHRRSGELLAANAEGAALLAARHSDWLDAHGRTPWEAAPAEGTSTAELLLTVPGGAPRWVSAFSRRTTTGLGDDVVVTTLVDTTERRGWAAELLEDFRSRFAMSWMHSELPVALVGVGGDECGRVLVANDATRALLGGRAIEGLDLADAFAGLSPEVPLVEVVTELCAGHSHHSNVLLTGTDGASVLLGLTVARAQTGRPLFILAHALDQSRLVEAEAAHRRELARGQAIHAHSSDVVVVIDADGTLRYVGPSSASVLGWEGDAVLGSSIFDLVDPDDSELAVEALMNTAERPGPAAPLRARARHANGTSVPVEVVAVNLLGQEDVDGIVVTIRDMSAEDEEHEETSLREQRYRRIVEHASDGILVVDEVGVITYVNGRMAEIIGCSVPELIGRRALELSATDALPDAQEHIDRAQQGIEERFPFELLRADGTTVQVLVSSSPLMRDGVLLGAVSWLTDMTEIERTRLELDQSVRSLRALLGALPDLIFRMDRDGRYLDYHCSDRSMLAVAPEEFLGRTVTEVLTEERAPGLASDFVGSIRRSLDSEVLQTLRYELEVGSDPRRFEARFTPAGADEVLVIVRDVTDLHRSEQLRLEQASELMLRQAQLERSSLERALERTRRTEAMGYLAATMAHDVNNLLGVVNNYASAIRRGAAEPQIVSDAEQIAQAVQRGAELTRQLLSVGQQPSGAHRELELRSVVADLADTLRGAFLTDDGVSLAFELGDDPAPVIGSRERLEQAVTNLVINARDASEAGGRGHVDVALRLGDEAPPDAIVQSEHPGPFVVVEVDDDGEGIPEEDRHRIFDPFVSTKQPQGGTGLGLSIVRDVVREHRGAVTVSSSSSGTTIAVWLPLHDAADGPGDTSSATVDRCSTVLLVDDDEHVRSSTKRLLEQFGIDVVVADCGATALEMLAAGSAADAVLTDVRMRAMSGPELARRVLQQHPGLPIAFVTGYPQDVPDTAELRGIPCLAKPYDPVQLGVLIAELLPSAVTGS